MKGLVIENHKEEARIIIPLHMKITDRERLRARLVEWLPEAIKEMKSDDENIQEILRQNAPQGVFKGVPVVLGEDTAMRYFSDRNRGEIRDFLPEADWSEAVYVGFKFFKTKKEKPDAEAIVAALQKIEIPINAMVLVIIPADRYKMAYRVTKKLRTYALPNIGENIQLHWLKE